MRWPGRNEISRRELMSVLPLLALPSAKGKAVASLEPVYRVSFSYGRDNYRFRIEGSSGTEWQYFSLFEGTAEGLITGRTVGANHPRRRADGLFLPNLQGVVVAESGGTLYFDHQGIAGPHPSGAWSVVTSVSHVTEAEELDILNRSVCVGIGDASTDDILIDVQRVVWEQAP